MDSIKDAFIELGSRAGGLKIHLEVIVEIFDEVKERYLTK